MRGLAMDFAIRGVPVGQVLAYTRQLVARGVAWCTYEMKGYAALDDFIDSAAFCGHILWDSAIF